MAAIVLYPSPAIGHLISMVELGKLILTHQPSLSIHIVLFIPPYDAGSTDEYVAKVSDTIPSITFHHLPTITLPSSITNSSPGEETLIFEVLKLNNPNLHQTLASIANNHSISSFITDIFCTCAFSITSQLQIPSYIFFASGASSAAVMLYFPTIHKNTTRSLKDIDTILDIPGLPSIQATDMPKPILKRDVKSYQSFLDCAIQCPKTAGIIVNTFQSLQQRAIKAITNGLCVPDGLTPPIYCVGPLIAANDRKGSSGGDCLTWLDSQPSQSVVFLCFGSLGLFSEEQLKEIAIGLENSGQRFLWVVRNPPLRPDADLNSLLPEGFLERTKERGLLVKSWAPQVAVLNHDSVGGFVTHCGWNSVLEAVSAGVPMVAWPLYAEQGLNRMVLVEEIKIALPITESENGFVSSAEVEKRVRELMNSEEGDSVRKRITFLKNEAKAALSEGGSSRIAVAELVKSWK